MDGAREFSMFLFMKDCLKKFNYPLIHGLSDEEITKIFEASNRQFLVSWIFKQMDEELKNFVENCTKEELADLVWQHGFCAKSNKNKFIDGTMSHSSQAEILHNMFKFFKNISDSKEFVGQEDHVVTGSDLSDLAKIDTNLFAAYGPKQVLTSKQRSAKTKEYKIEIAKLEQQIASKELNRERDALKSRILEIKASLRETMRDFEANLPDFKRAAVEISQLGREDPEKIVFGPEFRQTLETFTKESQQAHEFIKNVNLLTNDGEKGEGNLKFSAPDMKNKEIMKEISGLCDDIDNASK